MAFFGGVFLAVQAVFNSQLTSVTKQPFIAVVASSVVSVVLGFFSLLLINKETIHLTLIRQVPWYLWFSGGLFSMMGISLYFHTIPKLGISKMITLGLCGQLLFSFLAGKYGWLNLPIETISTKQIIGIIFMITAIILINSK